MSGAPTEQRIDMASERVGGCVLFANDEFFAPKENLLKVSAAVWLADEFTDAGKWMDGWETRRRREPGHDWCIIRLGLAGRLEEVVVDTAYFKGNYPEACSLEACTAPSHASQASLTGDDVEWTEVLARSPLKGDSLNRFALTSPQRFTHLRLRIYPDGGVARLRVYGEVVPDWRVLRRSGDRVDLGAAENGALVVTCSDMFFGSRHNLILPGPARNMGEGWETKRRRGPGNDWAVVGLAAEGRIERVEVDTTHFKGNAPGSCLLEVAQSAARGVLPDDESWSVLLPRTPLLPHTRHFFEEELAAGPPATHARLSIFPDGGCARLRLWGRPSDEGWLAAGLEQLNARAPRVARAELHQCCGSEAWAEQVSAALPVADLEALRAVADRAFEALRTEDWLEAFSHHPRIGERAGQRPQTASATSWSEAEQAGTEAASAELLATLSAKNRAYEERFGRVFLVCATGKSAAEMLALLEARLANDAATELRVAALEQRKIAHLRLHKLLER